MKLCKKLKEFKKKIKACPEVAKVEFREIESHIPNNVEATVTLKTSKRPNLEKMLSKYKQEYEGISEIYLVAVGKHKVVMKFV